MRRLEELFRHDFWTKILALALALIMWAMVVQDYNKESVVSFDVPLRVKMHPTLEVWEARRDGESEVEVRVTGPNLLLTGLSERDFEAWVDYSRVTEPGRAQDIEVQVKGPDRIRDQVKYRVTPASVPVTLVQMRDAEVPVEVRPVTDVVRVGEREFRFTAEVDPKVAVLRGRVDFLGLVRATVARLEGVDLVPPLVDGVLRQRTTKLRKPVQPVDANGQPVEKLAQPYANVTLTWEELPPGRSVQVQPRTAGSLPPGYELVSVSVQPDLVTLRSATVDGRLPEVRLIETEPVDLTGQTKSFTTMARVVVPGGTSTAVQSVSVTVTVAEGRMERVFGALPIQVRRQQLGVEATLAVSTVQVRITGPYHLVAPMDAGSIEVYVDLEGRNEGAHRVPVKVNYPPGVLEVAVDPAVVEVEIRNR